VKRLPQSDLPLRLATRGSALAMAQTRIVEDHCHRNWPDLEIQLQIIKTSGDRFQAASLQGSPDLPKGLFTKELEEALSRGEADLAIHSLKDLPTDLPENMKLGAVLPRADVRDVLITRVPPAPTDPTAPAQLNHLSHGARVATSSTRRAAQLNAQRPDLGCVEIRGNVPTRLQKLAASAEFDATILAAAGLERLGIAIRPDGTLEAPAELAPDGWGAPLYALLLPTELMLPAPGQGAIGVECRNGDQRAAALCRAIDHAESRACVEAERAFLATFGGGCQSPVAAWARITRGERLSLTGMVFTDSRIWREDADGSSRRPRMLGAALGRMARLST
jgi:hydroxymethylbilane synthase